MIQPEDLHAPEVLEQIAAAQPEVLTTCAYGVLIKEPLLSDYEMINVHPSLLPRWRGAAPIERAIMAGDDRDRRDDHARHRRLGLRRRSTRSAPSRSAPTTTTARSRRGWPSSARELLVKALDEHPTPRRAGRVAGHVRAQDRAARARAGPDADPGGRSSARSAPCARTSAPGSRCPTARFLGVIGAAVGRPDPRARRRPGPHRGRPAAARLQRRRAGADRDQAARRPRDGRRRLAARAPRPAA